jgi:hypothetical protein
MPAPDYDRRYVEAVLPDLHDYLLVNEIYWPVRSAARRGEPPFPQFTLGNLLLSLRRLGARRMPTAEQAEAARLQTEVDLIRNRWRVAWENKAGREFTARLRLWRDFLEELREEPSRHADRYAYEVGRRVILNLLVNETSQIPPAERELLSGLDGLLRAIFMPGDFIWETDLQRGFPAEEYWFLYGGVQILSP